MFNLKRLFKKVSESGARFEVKQVNSLERGTVFHDFRKAKEYAIDLNLKRLQVMMMFLKHGRSVDFLKDMEYDVFDLATGKRLDSRGNPRVK